MKTNNLKAKTTAQNDELSEYTVSKNTGSFIDAILALNEAFEKTFEAMSLIYSERADYIMNNEIYPKFSAFKELVEKYLLISISENIYDLNNPKKKI